MYTFIPLRFENEEVKLGSATWSLDAGLVERHLLPTQILQKILKQSFQPRQLRDRKKKMEGHIVGTGVSVPSPPPSRPNVLVRLAHMTAAGGLVGKAGKRQSKGRVSSVTVAATVHFPQNSSFTVP